MVQGLSKVCFVNVWRYLRLFFGFIQEDRLVSFGYTAGKDQPVLVTSLAEIDTLQDSAQGGGGGKLELAKPPVDFLLSGRSPSVFFVMLLGKIIMPAPVLVTGLAEIDTTHPFLFNILRRNICTRGDCTKLWVACQCPEKLTEPNILF